MKDVLRYHTITWSSTTDGPGTRVVLFLHGCRWKCPWCHSPHLWNSSKNRLLFFASRCVKCRECKAVCPAGVHSFKNGSHILRRGRCVTCFTCRDLCPATGVSDSTAGALVPSYRQLSAEALFETLLPQLKLIRRIGGLTVSGGEPLLQASALGPLLQRCRTQGIPTAVETSGGEPLSRIKQLSAFVDTWLYGLRFVPDSKAVPGTLPPASTVLKNLEYLSMLPQTRVIIRIPIIPGFTHTASGLAKARQTIRRLGLHEIELLPQNPLAGHYYDALGLRRPGLLARPAKPAVMKAIAQSFRAEGFRASIIE